MSIELPRTAVALGITDPVEKARAELKAALAAIEQKANVPRRMDRAVNRTVKRAQLFAQREPAQAAAAAVGVALAVGTIVWGLVRVYAR